MSLWRIVVETTDSSGEPDRWAVLTLSHTEMGAKRAAGKAVFDVKGCEYRFIKAVMLDPYKTGVISVVHADSEMKEAPNG